MAATSSFVASRSESRDDSAASARAHSVALSSEAAQAKDEVATDKACPAWVTANFGANAWSACARGEITKAPVLWPICLSTGSSVGIGRLADLLEHTVERLAHLRLGRLRRECPERLRERPERIGIGRLADLFEHGVESPGCLCIGQLGRERPERPREDLEHKGAEGIRFRFA